MKKIITNNKLWENLGYGCLGLCMLANLTVGKAFVFAQCLYLIVNTINVLRNAILKRPMADKVRDIVFLGITVYLLLTL